MGRRAAEARQQLGTALERTQLNGLQAVMTALQSTLSARCSADHAGLAYPMRSSSDGSDATR